MIRLQRIENVLLFLTLLFLPTQLGKHFWPIFSHIYSLPIDYLSPTIYLWDLLVITLWIIFALQNKHINRLSLNLFLFFILTQALSLLSFSVNVGAGLVRLEQYLISGLLGIYIASTKFPKIKRIIFLALALSIFYEAILAILQFSKGGTLNFWILGERSFSLSTPGIAKFDFKGSQLLRPYATFPHPNVLAGYMVVSLLILNIFLETQGKTLRRPASLLAGLTTLLTVSRTAIFTLFFCGFLILNKKGRLLLIGIILILLPLLYVRYSSVLNFDNLTLTRREELFSTAVDLWYKSPIFGAGLNNFIVAEADSLLSGPNRFLQPVHNIYLLSLAETGLVGLIGLISLIGYPVFLLFKLNPKPRFAKRAYLLTPIFLVWLVIIFLGMFDHYFLTLPQGYRLLFLVWGLTFLPSASSDHVRIF